ncbi:unnamed protein product [Adineta ricciae]|uniref:Galectin n=1 Tax=Adineta ricciae TaxID=249248 RepID=A0A816AJL6_ADIRI|nr:unnamed protein product [Adineta ricciae]CAF1596622.1 unnamed protein product [Adineta ricciae]
MFPQMSFNPGFGLSVPYQQQITPSLSNGTQIHVSGTPTGNRFEINLKNHQDDIVLHFNPRLDDHTLVLNSAQRGSWGQEERQSLPFQRGVRFTLVITATDHSFRIMVNNMQVCEFRQRTPMHLAQLVEVKGDIKLDSVQVAPAMFGNAFNTPMGFPQVGMSAPFSQPGHASFSFGGLNVGFGIPSVPVPTFSTGGVPSIQSCRIHVGSRIFVRGFIPANAQRFELNLLQGYNDSDDIAFHFNPRFDTRQIVKNHRQHGQWGHEENQSFPPYTPLMPGMQIDLQITCNPDRYTIYMNNNMIAEYFHKITPGSVMAIQYKGDISVTSIGQM